MRRTGSATRLQRPLPEGAAGDARSLNARAVALINAGQERAAVPLLERAARLQPADAEILGNLGYAHLRTGRHPQAREYLLASLENAPNRSASWINLGQAYAELGDDELAVRSVLKGYRLASRRAAVRAALSRAAVSREQSPAWRHVAGRALERIESGEEGPASASGR